MLGDLSAEKGPLSLSVINQNKRRTGKTRLRFYMSSINKDLIYHLYSILRFTLKLNRSCLTERKIN
jgi:hypothetical protein